MRLLTCHDNGDVSLTKDLHDKIPPYAVLSHTWSQNNDDEVLFRDIQDNTWRAKPAAAKQDATAWSPSGLTLAVLTKSTMDEVQASINSMFQWYSDAFHCYDHLPDVSTAPSLSHSNAQGNSDQVDLS
jgi:hypothetical protein